MLQSQILLILGIPLGLGLISQMTRRVRILGLVNILGYLVVLLISFNLASRIIFVDSSIKLFNFIFLDALSVFFILVISIVSLACAFYSISYISRDVKEGIISPRKASVYYLLFNLFTCSMFFVTVVNNLGMLWVAVEMTTLISGFLVGFYNTKNSIEAAWKYIVICSVGIVLALLGTLLFYYASAVSSGLRSLNWTDMIACADKMDKNILKIAFIFILVGYGTKAGLAPMHTWLPDAHSQAVAPISALLSGVLLKTAIYAIIRFGIILFKNGQVQYFSNLMIFFGILSLGISAGLILVQKDIKRLLAYSSIEHIGIIAIGLGIGGSIGCFGALLHILNHAVTKSLMFFGAGNVVHIYKKHSMNSIKGVIKTMPFTGFMLLMGVFAITGLPPFSIFISEMIIILAAFLKGSFVVVFFLLLFIILVFSGVVHHLTNIIFGKGPKEIALAGEPLNSKLAFLFLLGLILILGVIIPNYLQQILSQAVAVMRGV